MSLLSQKSELNYASAEHLQKASYFCSVVHCAYYSSVQLMRHILLNVIGKAESEIRIESSQETFRGGSHTYMIAETVKYLVSKNNKEMKLFNTSINSLKKLRVDADYGEVNIDHDLGKRSLELSEVVNKILKKAC